MNKKIKVFIIILLSSNLAVAKTSEQTLNKEKINFLENILSHYYYHKKIICYADFETQEATRNFSIGKTKSHSINIKLNTIGAFGEFYNDQMTLRTGDHWTSEVVSSEFGGVVERIVVYSQDDEFRYFQIEHDGINKIHYIELGRWTSRSMCAPRTNKSQSLEELKILELRNSL
ncbi:MAG: hypothetical protein KDD58_07460 [Bdellovibrionales bacterium]|nr:hypothetical protein [Bdellovibrionales bacterium]